MAAIVIERTIAATSPGVFKVLTQQDEIVRWWADEARVEPEVGSLGTFRFRPPAGTLQFEVTGLDQDRCVRWGSRQGPPHWTGTSVTWQLEPIHNGTKVIFTHDGFAQEDTAYKRVQRNWEYFLNSLQAYLETGKGTPGLPPLV